jgi:hypothetical protein
MIVWETIVVEQLHGHWSACFANEPGTGYGGEWPSQAIDRLLEASSPDLFDTNQIHAIDEATRDGHLEFRIRFLSSNEFPVVSRN